MLVTERNGNVRVVENGQLKSSPLTHFNDVSTGGEEGLMGMALDPNYNRNKLVYVCLAYDTPSGLRDKVVRFVDNGSSAGTPEFVIGGIPSAQFHAGCKLKFGPDGKLYVSTGDATNKQIAQDLGSLGGKILRLNPDGTVPADNPFPNSPIWSFGHRNPQGLCFQHITNQLFSVEHGPSGFDGPGGGDEVNIIQKGANYGWPLVSHENKKAGTIAPLLVFTPAVAPSACTFYQGNLIPQFDGNMFFAALKGEGLWRIQFKKDNPSVISQFEKMSDINYGRLREVVEGPDGALYFTTSNRDGRGTPATNDDRILKIVPQ
jgi:glucose/arabinose dehydrogenase